MTNSFIMRAALLVETLLMYPMSNHSLPHDRYGKLPSEEGYSVQVWEAAPDDYVMLQWMCARNRSHGKLPTPTEVHKHLASIRYMIFEIIHIWALWDRTTHDDYDCLLLSKDLVNELEAYRRTHVGVERRFASSEMISASVSVFRSARAVLDEVDAGRRVSPGPMPWPTVAHKLRAALIDLLEQAGY